MEAGPELIEAMGAFGETFENEDDEMGFLSQMPLIKVPMMGMSDVFTMDDLDSFVARYGG